MAREEILLVSDSCRRVAKVLATRAVVPLERTDEGWLTD
jgi:hypothetical protein